MTIDNELEDDKITNTSTEDKAKEIGKQMGAEEDEAPEDVPEYEIQEEPDGQEDERLAKEREKRPEKKDRPELSNKEKRALRKKRISEKFDEKNEAIRRLAEENEQLKQWKQQVDNRLAGINQAEIQKAWSDAQNQLAIAKKDYADSFAEGDGAKNVQALAVMSDANDRLKQIAAINSQFVQRNEQMQQQPEPRQQGPDPVMVNKAKAWADRNSGWYNPNGTDVDSEIAKAISGALANEGYDPRSDDFWEELDDRLADKLPNRTSQENNDGDEDEEAEQTAQPKKRTSPPITNGQKRGDLRSKKTITLPTSYIKMLKDNGIWDDKKRLAKVLKERERILKEAGN